MLNVLRKLTWWFGVFGISVVVSNVLHWTTQGIAFLCIDIGGSLLFIIFLYTYLLLFRDDIDSEYVSRQLPYTLLDSICMSVIVLCATWLLSKILRVDFYITYEIITFGRRLYVEDDTDEYEDDYDDEDEHDDDGYDDDEYDDDDYDDDEGDSDN